MIKIVYHPLFVLFTYITLVVTIYLQALNNGFVWDDRLYLFDVEYLDPNLWKELLNKPFFVSPNYYRPLVQLSFLVQIKLHGLDPFYFHLVNIILLGVNGFFVSVLCLFLIKTKTNSEKKHIAAFIAGIIYICHPALIESVAWVSGRFDLMVSTFLLLILIVDTYITNHICRFLIVTLLYLFAAASKEAAICLPFVLIAWHLALTPNYQISPRELIKSTYAREKLPTYLAIIVGGIIYLIIRKIQLGYVYQSIPNMFTDDGLARLLLISKSLILYLILTVYPFTLISPVHPREFPFPLTDIWAWAALALVSLILITLLISIIIRRSPMQSWLCVGFLASFIPVVHIFPMTIGDNIVHERFMTFPLTLFSLILANPIFSLLTAEKQLVKKVAGNLILVVFLALSIANIHVSLPLWSNDLTLWKWAASEYPKSATAHANLSDAYKRSGELEKALEHGLKALEINHNSAYHFTTVGNALSDLGKNEEALEYHKMAVILNPDSPDLLNNAAVTLIRLGKMKEAEILLRRALSIKSTHRRCNLSMAILYLIQGNKNLSKTYLSEAKRMLTEREQKSIDNFFALVETYGSNVLNFNNLNSKKLNY